MTDEPRLSPDAQAYAALVVDSEQIEGAPWFVDSLRALAAAAFQAGIYHEQRRVLRRHEKESS